MLGVLALVVALSACPHETAVWVEEGSTAERLAFQIAERRGGTRPIEISFLRVNLCDGPHTGEGAHWVTGPVGGGTARADRIVYAAQPVGWVSYDAPRPITPGCYRVAISGTGRT